MHYDQDMVPDVWVCVPNRRPGATCTHDLGVLEPGTAFRQVQFPVRVFENAPDGAILNTVQLDVDGETAPENNAASATVFVERSSVNLSLRLHQVGPPVVRPGQTLTLVPLLNTDRDTEALVRFDLPDSVSPDGVLNSWTCANRTCHLSAPSLSPSHQAELEAIHLRVADEAKVGSLVLEMSASSPHPAPDPSDNTAHVTYMIAPGGGEPELGLVLHASTERLGLGHQDVVLELTVTNHGDGYAHDAFLRLPPPSYTDRYTESAWDCTVISTADPECQYNLGPLGPGDSHTVFYRARVLPLPEPSLDVTVEARALPLDPFDKNNYARTRLRLEA